MGITNFFSFLYSPGATKAQKLYIETGKVIAIERSKINLKGAKKGDATSTAIILEPSGKTFNNGSAKKLYILFANGVSIRAQIAIVEIIISSLFRSSKRWSVKE